MNLDAPTLKRLIAANPDLARLNPDWQTAEVSTPTSSAGAQPERAMQAEVFRLVKALIPYEPRLELLHASANSQVRRGRRIEPGIRAGIPDLFLPVPRPALGQHPLYHGLYVELKVHPNKPSAAQRWWLQKLKHIGYCAEVVYNDPQEVLILLAWYLDTDATIP